MVTRQPSVWTATAHPARRRLIELLHDGPRTTGDLARAFSTTRFAVMKHLRVLEAAGVVAVHRAGRSRWNELTPGPLADLDRHWSDAPRPPAVGTPASPPVPALDEAASPGPNPTRPFDLRLDVFLDAEPSRVFDAITFDMSAWWGWPYLRSANARSIAIEGFLGGRFFEEWGHRQGVLRGLVTAVEQDRLVEVSGPITRRGPFQASMVFTLQKREGGTRLEFSFASPLEPGDEAAAYERAWRDLIGSRLRAFVESGTRCGIGHSPAGALPAGGLF